MFCSEPTALEAAGAKHDAKMAEEQAAALYKQQRLIAMRAAANRPSAPVLSVTVEKISSRPYVYRLIDHDYDTVCYVVPHNGIACLPSED